MNTVVIFIGQLHPVVAAISMEGRGGFNLTASPTLVCTGKPGDAVGGGASAMASAVNSLPTIRKSRNQVLK